MPHKFPDDSFGWGCSWISEQTENSPVNSRANDLDKDKTLAKRTAFEMLMTGKGVPNSYES